MRTGRPNVAAKCHEHSCPLWRRHRCIPRTPHGGLPTTRHDGADCHHRRLQCSPINGRSQGAANARGHSGANGHATHGPTGPHSLSTRRALTGTIGTSLNRLPYRPLLRRAGTRRGNAGAIPRPSNPRSLHIVPWRYKSGFFKCPQPPRKRLTMTNNTNQDTRRTRNTQMDLVLLQGAAHPGPTRRDRPKPCHATSGHGVWPPRGTPVHTGQCHPASGSAIHGHRHMAPQTETTYSDTLPSPTGPARHPEHCRATGHHTPAAQGLARPPSEGTGTRTATLLSEPQALQVLKARGQSLGRNRPQGIKAVRLQNATVTKNPKMVLEEVLNSFQRDHSTEDEESSAYTEELISHLPKNYNRTQRRDMKGTPFTIREPDEVLYKLQPGNTPGVDGLPAELYRRLPLNLNRHLAARL